MRFKLFVMAFAAAAMILAPAAAMNATASQYYQIMILGDQLSHNTYVEKLRGMLQLPSAYDYSFDVRSHLAPGRTAAGLLESMQNDGWLADNPNCVIIMTGTNDIVNSRYTEPDSQKAARQTLSDVQKIVDYVAANTPSGRPKIFVSALPPSLDASICSRIGEFNVSLNSEITNVDAVLWGNWEDLYDASAGTADSLVMYDYIYPNVLGNWEIALNIYHKLLTSLNPSLMNDTNNY